MSNADWLDKPYVFIYIFVMLIPTKENVKTVTDMRQDALGVINQVQASSPVYVMYKSQPKAVLLSVESYVDMYEKYCDFLDAVETERLASEPKGKGYTLKQIHDNCL